MTAVMTILLGLGLLLVVWEEFAGIAHDFRSGYC